MFVYYIWYSIYVWPVLFRGIVFTLFIVEKERSTEQVVTGKVVRIFNNLCKFGKKVSLQLSDTVKTFNFSSEASML